MSLTLLYGMSCALRAGGLAAVCRHAGALVQIASGYWRDTSPFRAPIAVSTCRRVHAFYTALYLPSCAPVAVYAAGDTHIALRAAALGGPQFCDTCARYFCVTSSFV